MSNYLGTVIVLVLLFIKKWVLNGGKSGSTNHKYAFYDSAQCSVIKEAKSEKGLSLSLPQQHVIDH